MNASKLNKSKINMDRRCGKEYNNTVDSLACQLKEVNNMASHKTVKGNLYNDKGIWTVRGRVFDPNTGKIKLRAKSTGFKVKDCTKRKAEQAMRDIIAGWEMEANTAVEKRDPLFSEYIQKWLEMKAVSREANSVKSYRDYANKHILPALGSIKIQQLTLQHLQIYYKEKLKTLSVVSLRKHHVVISGALLNAVRDGIISRSILQNMSSCLGRRNLRVNHTMKNKWLIC